MMKTPFLHDYGLLLHEYPPQEINEANNVILNDAYRAALQQTAKISITDHQGIILYVNEKFCEICQHDVHELIGKKHNILNSGYHPPSFFSEMWQTIQSGQIWKGEICNKSKYGDYYWVDTVIVPFRNNYASQYKYLSIRFDITERKRAEELLQASESVVQLRNQELERSQTNLEEAIEFVIHELKNPLCNILLLSEFFDEESKGNSDLSLLNTQLRTITERTLNLIQNFLDTRISDNEPLLPFSGYFNWYRLAEFLVKQYQIKAQRNGININIQGNAETSMVYADIELVTQVMDNLVSNALKYSGQGKTISIKFERLPSSIECSIRDEGIGMDRKELGMLFTRYGMLSSRYKANAHSSGLGLYMTKKMVEEMNGRIWCSSELGKGTIFFVHLPITHDEVFVKKQHVSHLNKVY